MVPAMLKGAVWAVVLSFPLAAMCALVYRFPLPLVGYGGGPDAVDAALLAVVFFLAFGGFPVLLAAGAAAGAAAHVVGRPDLRRVRWLVPVFAALVTALLVGLLAILDKLIGPW